MVGKSTEGNRKKLKVGNTRKTRSDRKRDIKPTISVELKDCIYRLSYILDTPVKDVVVDLCIAGASSDRVMALISGKLRRDMRIEETVYIGDLENESNRCDSTARRERITSRFKIEDYEILSALSYGLDCSVSRACAILLDASIREIDIIREMLKEGFTQRDKDRMRELRSIMKYVNEDNPFDDKLELESVIEMLARKTRDKFQSVNARDKDKSDSSVSESVIESDVGFKINSWR